MPIIFAYDQKWTYEVAQHEAMSTSVGPTVEPHIGHRRRGLFLDQKIFKKIYHT